MSAAPAPIDTARLRLVPLAAHHVTPRYVAWLNDPEVMRFSRHRHRTHTLASVRDYVQSFEGSDNRLWAIELREAPGTHLGNINATIDAPNGVGDVGILLGERAFWGRGFGREAWTAVCRYLLDDLGLRKVTGGTVATNVGMLAVMRAAGMREDGVRVRQELVDGREIDLIHMALFRTPLPDRLNR
ncbi:MAG: GNAT family N-acetyltransferase [Vicinamibacterales bacterium]